MKLIERVARGMCRADPDIRRGDADGVIEQSVNRFWHLYADAAKAAIRAVLDGVEPVAWLVVSPSGYVRELHRKSEQLDVGEKELGWTETPLYSLDALKEALDHD